MEIKEIIDTISNEPNMEDLELQKDILNKIETISRAGKVVDSLACELEGHKDSLNEEELDFIHSKYFAYVEVFNKFRNGDPIDCDKMMEISQRVFELQSGINNNNFYTWKQEFMSYKGTKADKAENKMIESMLAVIPEEESVFDKLNTLFKKLSWKLKNKE